MTKSPLSRSPPKNKILIQSRMSFAQPNKSSRKLHKIFSVTRSKTSEEARRFHLKNLLNTKTIKTLSIQTVTMNIKILTKMLKS
jgi:hypothetical protein